MERGEQGVKRRPYTVCLLGASLDGGNMGVCALAAATLELVRRARPEARLLLFYGERRGGLRTVPGAAGPIHARVLNHRFSPRARLGEHLAALLGVALLWRLLPPLRGWLLRRNLRLRALASADVVGTIHGGDSFSDIYNLRRFLVGVIPDVIALLLGKRLVFLPQTYGPFSAPTARWVARRLMLGAERLYARDRHSLALVQQMLGPAAAGRAEFCPDVAFALEPARGGELAVEPPLPEEGRGPLLGLNVSGLLAIGGYTGQNMFGLACDYNALIAELIEALLREAPEGRLLLTPHVVDGSAESDVAASQAVWRAAQARHPGRVHLLAGRYNQSQVKRLIGETDFFIGARMHACIAALSQGVPAMGIAYSDKFRGVFESAGVGELVIDARGLAQEEIIARCLEALRRREAIRERLAGRVAALRQTLDACFQEALGEPPAPMAFGKTARQATG